MREKRWPPQLNSVDMPTISMLRSALKALAGELGVPAHEPYHIHSEMNIAIEIIIETGCLP